MSTKTNETTPEAVVPSIVYLAIDVADRTSSTVIALLQDARAELRASVDGGIELAENVSRALFRFARKAAQRIDDASADTLTGVATTLIGAATSARGAVKAAADLTVKAADRVTAGDRAAA